MVPDWYCEPTQSGLSEEEFVESYAHNSSFHRDHYQACATPNASECAAFRFVGPYYTTTEEVGCYHAKNTLKVLSTKKKKQIKSYIYIYIYIYI